MVAVVKQKVGIDNIEKEQEKLQSIIQTLLNYAKTKGASAAEISASVQQGLSATVRMGEVETIEYQRDKGLGLTVYFGQRKGSASTTDFNQQALQETLEKACAIATNTHEDPFAGLADKELLALDYPDLKLYYPWEITSEQAIELAKNCEEKGLSYDARIKNSEGASINTNGGVAAYGNSHGFIGSYAGSRHSISLLLIAQEADNMQRDYGFTVARDPAELEPITKVATEAATKSLRRLDAHKLKTLKAPVIFEADIASGLLSSFFSAIRGGNLYRNASFLVNHLGKKIFPDFMNISERPHLKKGLASSPFDGEGVKTQDRNIIEKGVLQGYVLSSYSARKLGMQTTGNADGIHNIIVSTSDKSLGELIKEMDTGLIVTEVLGQGVNIVTGDYSRGAFGFWVEGGEIKYPVEEITIAGNLKNIFAHIVNIGNDIDVRHTIQTGSILVEEMSIAGV